MSKTDPDIEIRIAVFNRDHGRCFHMRENVERLRF